MKYVFFNIRETRHTEQQYEYITMIEKIIIIILVMLNCCLSHVLKDFIKLT